MIYACNSGNLQIESTAFAGGRINLARNTGDTLTQDVHYFHTDHMGSVRAITNQSGETIEQNAYYPFGSRHTFGATYAQTTNRFKFNSKEEQTTGNLGLLDYGARMYDSKIARWFVQDPLSEKYYAHSPYNYCVNNPVMFVDPNGMRTWPINEVYKNYKRRHENNFNSQRDNGKRYHKGIDINYEAAGDNDLGAPIFATHDGIITRVVNIDTGDKDSGGNRVKIESVNGEVSTYYMHLDEIFTDIQVGESVIEGQQIGTMGGSGNGKRRNMLFICTMK